MKPYPQHALPYVPTPDEVLARILAGKDRALFLEVFVGGDTTRYRNDHSKADFAMCHKLVFYCDGNAALIDQVFRRSALMRPKWDTRRYRDGRTYGQACIARAIQRNAGRLGWTGPYTGTDSVATPDPTGDETKSQTRSS